MWLILPCLANAAEIDPLALVNGLQRELPARTAYTEVRFSQMYDRAVIARGELEYLGPGKLGKRVDSPYKEITTIADGEVTIQRGSRAPPRRSRAGQPAGGGLRRRVSALLGGDVAALQRDFEVQGSGSAEHWQLRLSPRDKRLKARIEALQVDGAGSKARCFSIIDADADVSILMVEELATMTLPKPLTQKNVELTCRRGTSRS